MPPTIGSNRPRCICGSLKNYCLNNNRAQFRGKLPNQVQSGKSFVGDIVQHDVPGKKGGARTSFIKMANKQI